MVLILLKSLIVNEKVNAMNWNDYRQETKQNVGEFGKLAPDTLQSVVALGGAAQKIGKLDAKTRELISLAVAVTTRCDGCISVHSEAAVKAGATEEEIAEALSVAVNLNTGAAMVYSSRVLDAVRQVKNKA